MNPSSSKNTVPPPFSRHQRPGDGTEWSARDLRGCVWACSVFSVSLAFLGFGLGFLIKSCQKEPSAGLVSIPGADAIGGEDAAAPVSTGESQPVQANPASGLKFEQLALTSIPLIFQWREEDALVDDEMSGFGSTCVVGALDGNLVLVTNRHCLGLDELARSDGGSDPPEILEYSLHLKFPGERIVKVSAFSCLEGAVDLAIISVPLQGLVEGQDFVVSIPEPEGDYFKIGEEVVAVGSPFGLEGTHTFGRISALRNINDSNRLPYQVIQTDAAINPGNSGGPLFWKRNDRFTWIGINTSRLEGGGQNLGFAIARFGIGKRLGASYEATPVGVRKYFLGE